MINSYSNGRSELCRDTRSLQTKFDQNTGTSSRQHGLYTTAQARPIRQTSEGCADESTCIKHRLVSPRTFSSSSVNPRPSFVFMLYRIVLPWTIGRSIPLTGRGEIAFAFVARATVLRRRREFRWSARSAYASCFQGRSSPFRRRTISSTLLARGLVEPGLHPALPVFVAVHVGDDIVVSRHFAPSFRRRSVVVVPPNPSSSVSWIRLSRLPLASTWRPARPHASIPSCFRPRLVRRHVRCARAPPSCPTGVWVAPRTTPWRLRSTSRTTCAPFEPTVRSISRRGSSPKPERSRPRRCTDPPGPARRHRFEYSHGGCECIRKGWVGGSTQPSLTDVAIERGSAAASQIFTGVSCVAHERKHDGGASKDGSEAWKRRGRIDKEEWRRNGKEETWLTDGTCTGNDAWTTGTARGNRTMCVSETTMDIQQSVQCFGKKKTSVAVAHCKRGRGLLKLNGE